MIGVPGADPDDLAWLLEVCRPIAERFVGAGHEILLVGGAVRDLATGRDVRRPDLDLTTDARPPETLRLLDGWVDAVWRQGERFGTIGARRGDHELEVTTFRAEAYDPDSRKPTVTFGDRVEDDLARRDFTVNAMALRLPTGELVDPHDGLTDLAARRLRTPLAAEVSFADDPLRMLRAARFAAGYGLEPDPTVVAAARELAGRMDIVSVERIHDELTKLLRLPDPAAGLRFLVATDLAPHTLPELAAADRGGFDRACAAVAAVPWDPEPGPDALLRLVVLLVALDPVAIGAAGPSASGHRIGGRLAALRHSAADTARGRHLAAGAGAAVAGVDTDARAREVLAAAGSHAPDVLVVAAALVGLPGADAVPAAVERLARVLASEPDLVALAPELRGDEVMARYGIGPGPEVGRALAAVRAARLAEGPLRVERAWEVVDGVLGDGRGPSDR